MFPECKTAKYVKLDQCAEMFVQGRLKSGIVFHLFHKKSYELIMPHWLHV
jgi:hypothetical protein